MLVTLPFVLLLLDFWPLKRLNFDNEHDGGHYSVSKKIKKIGLEKVPLLALSLIFSLLTYMAERDVGALSETGALPMIDRLINALVAYVVYLYKMIYPFDLCDFYPSSRVTTLERAAMFIVAGNDYGNGLHPP